MDEKPASQAERDSESTDRLTGTTVLLVDDDTETLQVLSAALADSGATVLTASSARRGLEVSSAATPDVIVSDISMPQEDGYAFIRKLRDHAGRPSAACP